MPLFNWLLQLSPMSQPLFVIDATFVKAGVAAPAVPGNVAWMRRPVISRVYQSKTADNFPFSKEASNPMLVDLFSSHPVEGFPRCVSVKPEATPVLEPVMSYEVLFGEPVYC